MSHDRIYVAVKIHFFHLTLNLFVFFLFHIQKLKERKLSLWPALKYEIRQHLNAYYNRYLKKNLVVLLAWLDFIGFDCQIFWGAVVVHNYSNIWFVKTYKEIKIQ